MSNPQVEERSARLHGAVTRGIRAARAGPGQASVDRPGRTGTIPGMSGKPESEIVVGTRGSLLAVAQTGWVINEIRRHHPNLVVRTEHITTAGDRDQTAPLPEVGQKGIFTKELEEALLAGRIDLAVHSAKDLPEEMPAGLGVLCIPAREDPRDALISRDGLTLEELPAGAVVGTSSLRRQAQLRLIRPDFQFTVLRGNVDTRIRKVHRGDCDATLLAMAGLNRVKMANQATCPVEIEVVMPAPHQGILAVQGRADDERMRRLLASVENAESRLAFSVERDLVERLEGGCRTPIGLLVVVGGGGLSITAVVAAPDGSRCARARAAGGQSDAAALAGRVLQELKAQGAGEIIAACRA
ncbi:MAG: hydroxymethylbilane synthase [Phycisphaerae bacterium]|nr:hydroxymethylbilane synthase [Phycisphaerae bacterium]